MTWPDSIDRARLIEALASAETGNGRDLYPRFEAAYAPKDRKCLVQGRYILGSGIYCNPHGNPGAQRQYTDFQRWGSLAAASHGDCQIMYATARDCGYPHDIPPEGLMRKAVWLPWVTARLVVLAGPGKCETVSDFARAWNGGNKHAQIDPAYVVKVKAAYATGKP
jgi:hypothetical protein